MGVNWKVADGEKVSTTASGKRIWTAGVSALAESIPEAAKVSQALNAEKDFRHKYPQHLASVAALSGGTPEAAEAYAEAALAAFHDEMVFTR